MHCFVLFFWGVSEGQVENFLKTEVFFFFLINNIGFDLKPPNYRENYIKFFPNYYISEDHHIIIKSYMEVEYLSHI